jgi:hypothetical protein
MKNLKYIFALLFIASIMNFSNAQKVVDHRTSISKKVTKKSNKNTKRARVVDHRTNASKTTSNRVRPTAPGRPSTTASRRSTSNNSRTSTSARRRVVGSRTNTSSNPPKSKPGYVWKNGHWEREKAVPKDVQLGTRRNRRYLKKMEELVTTLNHTNDVWAKDTILMTFEKYRRVKINSKYLNYYNLKEQFNEICNDFDAKYGGKKVMEIREDRDFHLLVEGAINNLSNQPFKYYPLPSKARLLPVQNQQTGEANALGFVYYQATGDKKLKLSLDVSLKLDTEKINGVQEKLAAYNIELEQSFPKKYMTIDEQSISIKGLSGRVIPVGHENIRIELMLPDDGLSLIKLFSGPILFNMNYTVQGKLAPFKQQVEIAIDPSLLNGIDQQAILNSFSAVENMSLIEVVKLSSLLDAARENEETLNRVDVSLEFQFENQTVFRGPIRLSSNGTLASDQVIEFLKYSDEYKIKVSGTAYYENGTREIKTFSTTDQIILIDESKF